MRRFLRACDDEDDVFEVHAHDEIIGFVWSPENGSWRAGTLRFGNVDPEHESFASPKDAAEAVCAWDDRWQSMYSEHPA